MQLFAYDKQGIMTSARHAIKRQDYTCLECASAVRVRAGLYRKSHFYHISPDRTCRQSGKSLTHIQIQNRLQQILPDGESSLEHPFPLINRIADVVWHNQKIVFEVQCSSITAEEVEKRNRDYAREGCQVVWILHERRFHRRRETAAERFLRRHPHYYTDINESGEGVIYDTFRACNGQFSRFVLGPFPVNLARPSHENHVQKNIPPVLMERVKSWSLYFEGDLLSQVEGTSWDRLLQGSKEPKRRDWMRHLLFPYRLLFQILLERYAK